MDRYRLGGLLTAVCLLLGFYVGARGQSGLSGSVFGVQQSGSSKGGAAILNCSTNVTCSLSGGVVSLTVASAGSIANTTNVLKGDGSGNASDAGFAASATGIVSLFSMCSGTQYLGADGACHSAASGPSANQNIRSVGAGFSGGGSALTTGTVAYITMPPACTIAAYDITIDTGTISFDVWKIATGTAIPTVSNTILTGGYLAISTGTAVHSTSTALFTTTTSSANDIYGFEVQAVSSATQASIVLQCNATS